MGFIPNYTFFVLELEKFVDGFAEIGGELEPYGRLLIMACRLAVYKKNTNGPDPCVHLMNSKRIRTGFPSADILESISLSTFSPLAIIKPDADEYVISALSQR